MTVRRTVHMIPNVSKMKCPECNAELIECVVHGVVAEDEEGNTEEDLYDAIKCPNGCDLWDCFD